MPGKGVLTRAEFKTLSFVSDAIEASRYVKPAPNAHAARLGSRAARKHARKAGSYTKKQPVQARAVLTYRSIVSATARVLERRGYEGLTTNQVARTAGVGIASVYEYFPGKHSLVAAVVTEVIDGVIRELREGLDDVLAAGGGDAVEHWISLMFAAVERRRRLVAVLVEEVPFLAGSRGTSSARAPV